MTDEYFVIVRSVALPVLPATVNWQIRIFSPKVRGAEHRFSLVSAGARSVIQPASKSQTLVPGARP